MPTRIDLQRYKKTYPFIRREPQYHYVTERPMRFEIAQASFDGSDTITYNFSSTSFLGVPKITITPVGLNANVNVYIHAVSKNFVIIKASAPTDASVHIHAIEIN